LVAYIHRAPAPSRSSFTPRVCSHRVEMTSRIASGVAETSLAGCRPRPVPCRPRHRALFALPGPEAADLLATGRDMAASISGPSISGPAAPYQFEPVQVGWEIWVGSLAGVFPFIIGASEFSKRILIQRRCERCRGSGLVERPAPGGSGAMQLRKCPECGGFFPWQSWRQFFEATSRPGNGGPLLQPRGQTSVLYRVPPPPPANGGRGAGESVAESVERPKSENDGAQKSADA